MTKLQDYFTHLFSIRTGEGFAVGLLLLHSFCKGISVVFFETLANTLFLQKYDSTILPYVYIFTALFSVLVGLIYTRLEIKFTPHQFLPNLLLVLIIIQVLLYLLLVYSQHWLLSSVLIFIMMIWKGMQWILLNLQFWAIAGLLFNIRQGKRLFGLICAGEIIANIIGGLLVSSLVHWLGLNNLLLFSLSGLIASFFILFYLLQLCSTNNTHLQTTATANYNNERRSWQELFNNSYIVLFFVLSMITSIGYYWIDFIFYDSLSQYNQGEESIAQFFGSFFMILGFVNLIGNTLLSAPLLSRYGLSLGLIALPVVILMGMSIALMIHHAGWGVNPLFTLIIIMKLADEVLRTSLETPTFRILYQPLRIQERLNIQWIRETIIEPFAIGLAGVSLLIFNQIFEFKQLYSDVIDNATAALLLSAKTASMLYLTLALSILWLCVALLLKWRYTFALFNAMSQRRLDNHVLLLEDASSLPILQRGLESHNAGEVIYCLTMLENAEHTSLEQFMIRLLEHPHAGVRTHVLQRIEQLKLINTMIAVRRRIKEENEATLKGLAIRTFCALAEHESFELAAHYSEDNQLEIRRGALVGLFRSGGIDGILKAGENLTTLLNSTKSQDRAFAAEVLGEVGIYNFFRPLLKLLNDHEIEVQQKALLAAGKLRNPELLSFLLEALTIPLLREYAATALIQYHDNALSEIEKNFILNEQNLSLRIWLIRILVRIGSPRAISILKKYLDFPINELQHHILQGLVYCQYQAQANEINIIKQLLKLKVEQLVWLIATLEDFNNSKQPLLEQNLLINALNYEIHQYQSIIFALLTFLYPTKLVLGIQQNIYHASLEARATALELLETIVERDLKNLLLPLLEDLSPAQTLTRLAFFFPQTRLLVNERLKMLANRPMDSSGIWIRAMTLYLMGKQPHQNFYSCIVNHLSSSEVILRETAVWALVHLNPDDLVERLQFLKQDRSPAVNHLVRKVFNSLNHYSLTNDDLYHHIPKNQQFRVEFQTLILMDEQESIERRCQSARLLAAATHDVNAKHALLQALNTTQLTVFKTVLEELIPLKPVLNADDCQLLVQRLLHHLETTKQIIIVWSELQRLNIGKNLISSLQQEFKEQRALILLIMTVLTYNQHYSLLQYWYIRHWQSLVNQQIAEHFKQLIDEMLNFITIDKQETILMIFHYHHPALLIDKLKLMAYNYNIESLLCTLISNTELVLSTWTKACIVMLLGQLKCSTCLSDLVKILHSTQNQYLQETILFTLKQVDPLLFEQQLQLLSQIRKPAIRALVKRFKPT